MSPCHAAVQCSVVHGYRKLQTSGAPQMLFTYSDGSAPPPQQLVQEALQQAAAGQGTRPFPAWATPAHLCVWQCAIPWSIWYRYLCTREQQHQGNLVSLSCHASSHIQHCQQTPMPADTHRAGAANSFRRERVQCTLITPTQVQEGCTGATLRSPGVRAWPLHIATAPAEVPGKAHLG